MKRPIALIVDYIALIVAGTLCGAFLYTVFFFCTSLVVGRTVKISGEVLIYALFETLPVIFMLIALPLTLYKIRHKENPVSSAIVYSILIALTWLLLFPATLLLKNNIYKPLTPIEKLRHQNTLSSNYFRKSNGKIYYFLDEAVDKKLHCIVVNYDRSEKQSAITEEIDVSHEGQIMEEAEPYHEPLITEIMVDLPYPVLNVIGDIKMQAHNALSKGYLSWICFCSLAFALASIYAFSQAISWRYIRVIFTFIVTVVIIAFNSLYFSKGMNGFREICVSFFEKIGIGNFFTLMGVETPLMFANILTAAALIILGIFISKMGQNRN